MLVLILAVFLLLFFKPQSHTKKSHVPVHITDTQVESVLDQKAKVNHKQVSEREAAWIGVDQVHVEAIDFEANDWVETVCPVNLRLDSGVDA